jgi:hypothetical protein
MKFTGTVDSKEVHAALAVEAPRQVPYVMAIVLTGLATDGRDGLRSKAADVFDRPTPFTVNAFRAKPATKDRPVSEVYVPESQDDRGMPARAYLRPGVLGSYRRAQKKTEFLLSRLGVLPAGWVTAPGKGAKLDGNGNLSGRVYAQIINVLQLKAQVVGGRNIAERSRKRAARMGVDAEFFAIPPGVNRMALNGGSLPPGVWKHLPGRRLAQILKFVSKAGYKPRLRLRDEVQKIVTTRLPVRWAEASALIKQRFASNKARR